MILSHFKEITNLYHYDYMQTTELSSYHLLYGPLIAAFLWTIYDILYTINILPYRHKYSKENTDLFKWIYYGCFIVLLTTTNCTNTIVQLQHRIVQFTCFCAFTTKHIYTTLRILIHPKTQSIAPNSSLQQLP